MTRIEDDLAVMARDVRSGAAEVDVDAALAEVTRARPRRRHWLLGAAAAVVLVALAAGGAVLLRDRGDAHVVADGGPGTTADGFDPGVARQYVIETFVGARTAFLPIRNPEYRSLGDLLPNVTYEHLDGRTEQLTDLVVVGRVRSVEPGPGFTDETDAEPDGAEVDFGDPRAIWRRVWLEVEVEQTLGDVDAPQWLSVGMPFWDEPDELDRWEAGFVALGRAVFFLERDPTHEDMTGVYRPLEGMFIAPVARDGRLSLPLLGEDPLSDRLLDATPDLDALTDAARRGPVTLLVDEDGRVHDLPPTSGPQAPEGPDLAEAQPGREITFDRIGEVALGQRVPSAEVHVEEHPPCGFWPRRRPASSHADPDQTPTALVDASGGTPVLSAVYLRRNTTYRTASGVGVGTTLATLERIYGDDLVVDDPDPDATPTDGLTAYYQRVAGVRRGDHALAFYLRDDVVEAVKLSGADVWGDDEGCA